MLLDNTKYNIKKQTKIYLIIISITILTQLPILLPYNEMFKIPLIFMWLITIIFNVANGVSLKDNFMKKILIIGTFNIWILCVSIIDNMYLKSYHFISINLAFIFYVAGYSSKVKKKEVFEECIVKYTAILITTIITISIYLEYFSGISFNSATSYIYTSKNSIGGLVVISFILLDSVKKNIINKYLKFIMQSWFILFILLLQHRAGMVCIVVYFILNKCNKIKVNIKNL